jgi:hypothetical protein
MFLNISYILNDFPISHFSNLMTNSFKYISKLLKRNQINRSLIINKNY